MYHGHYFKLDTDVANIEKGIAIFRYCPDGKTDSDVYVTFSNDEIEFNSIGNDTNKAAMVLIIPIDENIGRSFASTVTEAFHWKVDDVMTISQDISHLSYYSTFYFGINSKHVKYWKKPSSKGKIYGSPSIPTPLPVRKLILDFLFDLQETRIFQMSPHYNELTEKLRQNFFAQCLIAKARYWYQRAIYQELLNEKKTVTAKNERKAQKNKRQFYGEMLFNAEMEWINCIRDTRSDKTFHDEFYDWFDDSETEMCRVYMPYLPIELSKGVLKDIKKEHDTLTSKWFVARHCAVTAWRIYMSGHRSFFGIHLFWPRILFSIGTAWFTLALIEGMSPPAHFSKSADVVPLIFLVLIMVFAVSLIAIRKVVPLVKKILLRAVKLSILVTFYSYIVGCVLLQTINATSWPHHKFLFFWFSAAFVGLVLQIVLQGDNPSEPM